MEQLRSGIAGFDAATNGGLPRGTRTVLFGPPGTGKTVFAMQFLWTGLQAGETVACLVSDRPLAHLERYFASFGWDIRPYEQSGHFIAAQSFPPLPDAAREPGLLMLPEGDLDALRAFGARLRERGVTRFVAGEQSQAAFSLTPIEKSAALGQWLAGWAFDNNANVLEIVTATQLDIEGHRSWSLNLKCVHNVIQFRIDGARRSVRIPKMEGAEHPLEWVPIEITPHGIEMGVA